jgi:hypothetical protein
MSRRLRRRRAFSVTATSAAISANVAGSLPLSQTSSFNASVEHAQPSCFTSTNAAQQRTEAAGKGQHRRLSLIIRLRRSYVRLLSGQAEWTDARVVNTDATIAGTSSKSRS